MRSTAPNFRPTHFTALFDATAHSTALRRYAMLTGAFERAKHEDQLEQMFDSMRIQSRRGQGYRTLSPQQLSNYYEQELRAGRSMREQHARFVADVEELGGKVVYPFVGHEDYCEVQGLTEDEARTIFARVYKI